MRSLVRIQFKHYLRASVVVLDEKRIHVRVGIAYELA